jgi:hypothetical protein
MIQFNKIELSANLSDAGGKPLQRVLYQNQLQPWHNLFRRMTLVQGKYQKFLHQQHDLTQTIVNAIS